MLIQECHERITRFYYSTVKIKYRYIKEIKMKIKNTSLPPSVTTHCFFRDLKNVSPQVWRERPSKRQVIRLVFYYLKETKYLQQPEQGRQPLHDANWRQTDVVSIACPVCQNQTDRHIDGFDTPDLCRMLRTVPIFLSLFGIGI